jgi:DHA1 family multidrug resistance protein-like MFS transporter
MNWKIFTTLFLAIFASMLGQGIVVPLLPVYAHELGASGFTIGIMFGIYSLSRTVFLPYFGSVSDRAGRKPYITAGLLAYFLASIAYMFSRDVNALIIVRFFQGIAAAMILPVAQAYVGEITPRGKEGFMMGLLNLSLYGGLSAGPVLGGIAKDTLGIRASFVSMGVLCILGFFLCLVFLPQKKDESLVSRGRPPQRIMLFLRNRHLLGMFLFRFAATMCIGAFWSFGPLIANTKFNLSGSATGILIMLSVLISAVLTTPMGYLADRFNKRFLVMLGGVMSVISMLFFAYSQEAWGLYAASILAGIGGGISVPAMMAMAVLVGRTNKYMGSVISLMTMGHSLGMMTGPILAGILIDLLDMRFTFLGMAAFMAAMTLLFMPLTVRFETLEKSF